MKIISHRGNLCPEGDPRKTPQPKSEGHDLANMIAGHGFKHKDNYNPPEIMSYPENSPKAIEQALKFCDMVEVDLWLIGDKWFLGHDGPEYDIPMDYIIKHQDRLLIHCKNLDAMTNLIHYQFTYTDLHFFWHGPDHYTLTSQQKVIAYPGQPLTEVCINMMPEITNYSIPNNECWGVCTDNPLKYLESKNDE